MAPQSRRNPRNHNPMKPLRTPARAAQLAAIALSVFISAAPVNAGPGNALSFDGTAGRCVTATIPALSSNYTVSSWVYLLAGGDYNTLRVGVLSGATCGGSAEMTVQNQAYEGVFGQYLMLGRCGYFNGMCSSSELPLGQWVHLAVTVDSAQDVSYYINGVAAGGYTAGAGSNLTIGPEIHLADNSVRTFNGTLDEVQIWSKVQSQYEIQDGMNQTPDVADTNLVAYWSFDDGSGTTATNSAAATGSACDGTLVNSPTWVLSTVPFVPDVTTAGATGISPTAATLTGTVNPCNLTATAWFQWGTDTNYGNLTATTTVASANQVLTLSNSITIPTPCTTDHYQLVAFNDLGLVQGADQSFTTLDVPRAITGCSLTATGQFQFQFTGAAASTYTVLCSTNLALPLSNWTAAGAAASIAPGQYQFTDCATSNQPLLFYLLRQP
jgi:hypothetical protein